MLIGLPGGRGEADGAPSGAEILARFARRCSEDEGDPLSAAIVIEVVGSFLAQVVVARGETALLVDEDEALAAVPARAIIDALGPCLLLFPFQGVVGSGIVEALPRQARALAGWLAREGLADDAALARFESLADRAEPDGRLHHALQARLDELFDPLPRAGEVERVVGRFAVTRAESFSLELSVPPTGQGYQLVVPAGLPVVFEEGHAVSMAIQRSPIGWIPLASSLPIRPEELDALFEEVMAPPPRGGPDRTGPGDSRAGPRPL